MSQFFRYGPYYHGAQPYAKEVKPVVRPDHDPGIQLVQKDGETYLCLQMGELPGAADATVVTTELLGKAQVSGLPYENPDGSPLKIDLDYVGNPRDEAKLVPGPFAGPGAGAIRLPSRR
ncbi:MAG: hypothetical protein FJ276_12360 [Planctomycetes bacterium]|nr:hypothetical protein [Planctomycetota bacterium]